jgi:hypothetical protein
VTETTWEGEERRGESPKPNGLKKKKAALKEKVMTIV